MINSHRHRCSFRAVLIGTSLLFAGLAADAAERTAAPARSQEPTLDRSAPAGLMEEVVVTAKRPALPSRELASPTADPAPLEDVVVTAERPRPAILEEVVVTAPVLPRFVAVLDTDAGENGAAEAAKPISLRF